MTKKTLKKNFQIQISDWDRHTDAHTEVQTRARTLMHSPILYHPGVIIKGQGVSLHPNGGKAVQTYVHLS